MKISNELFQKLEATASNSLSKYSTEDRIQTAVYYTITGSSLQTSKKLKELHGLDIKASTIRHWKNTSNWWPDLILEVRKDFNEKMDSKLTGIMMKAVAELEDRVNNGNWKLNPKTGELQRIPLTAHELAMDTLAIPFDKRALGRGEATSRTERISSDDLLKGLEKQFRAILRLQNESIPLIKQPDGSFSVNEEDNSELVEENEEQKTNE